MIRSPDGSWIYIGPPRTGSTLLHQLLAKPPVNGIYSGFQHDVDATFNGKIFVSVRNPFTRAISLWKHRRYELGTRDAQGTVTPVSEEELSFEEFLLTRHTLDAFYKFTICDWLADVHSAVTPVRVEHMAADIADFWPELKDEIPSKAVNSSAAAKCESSPYRNRELHYQVLAWGLEDLTRFGYPLCLPEEVCDVRSDVRPIDSYSVQGQATAFVAIGAYSLVTFDEQGKVQDTGYRAGGFGAFQPGQAD